MKNVNPCDVIAAIPPTEGIKYAGSKQKLLPYILKLIDKIKPTTILDGFAGSTRVAQALAQSGYTVIANDLAVWSEIFATCHLLNDQPYAYYAELIEHLNHLAPEDGWFTEHYGGDPNAKISLGPDGLKKPWQKHNTRRLDAIRQEIDRLTIAPNEKCVLLTSLVYALDAVDSTLGHFASYLHAWSPRSYKTLQLKVPLLLANRLPHRVYRQDIFSLLPQITVDFAYFDPPYGSNNEKMPPSRVRYAAYYHLWTTVCLNDNPAIFGKAKRRADTSDTVAASVFEEFRRDPDGKFIAVTSISQMLASVQAKHILLSYSSGGRATVAELEEAMLANGKLLEIITIDHKKNVMAGMRWTNAWIKEAAAAANKEFLFLLEKQPV